MNILLRVSCVPATNCEALWVNGGIKTDQEFVSTFHMIRLPSKSKAGIFWFYEALEERKGRSAQNITQHEKKAEEQGNSSHCR